MKYFVELKPKAIKNLNNIPKSDRKNIVKKLKLLEDNLQGDVKKFNNKGK